MPVLPSYAGCRWLRQGSRQQVSPVLSRGRLLFTRLPRWPARLRSAEEASPARVGGNVLVMAGARAEEVARAVSAFDAAVVLFQLVVQGADGPVLHLLAQLGADCPGVAVVTVRRDPVGHDANRRLC